MPDVSSTIVARVDLNQPISKTVLRNLFVTEDKNAHTFRIEITRAGEPVDLTGATVSGWLTRYKDNVSIPMEAGKIEGANVAVITMSENCYELKSMFSVVIGVSLGGVDHAVFAGEGHMMANRSDTILDTSGIIPSVQDIIAQYARMQEAYNEAMEAANAANTAAGKAPYVGSNGNWFVWDAEAKAYKDSGTKATGADGEDGDDGITPNITFTAATGEPGTDVQISQSGTAENPVVNLTIPRGIPGSGSVSSVNGVYPDESGNVEIDAGGGTVRTVNGVAPDKNGNVTIDVGGDVQTVDSIVPDTAGNVALGAVRYNAAQSLTDVQKAQALSNLGIGTGSLDGIQMELLWENASPTSEFAAQTIQLDLSQYEMVAISFYRFATTLRVNTAILNVGENGSLNDCYTNASKAAIISARTFETTTTGIAFAGGLYQSTDATSRTEDNRSLIPTRIYGIKGVKEAIE